MDDIVATSCADAVITFTSENKVIALTSADPVISCICGDGIVTVETPNPINAIGAVDDVIPPRAEFYVDRVEVKSRKEIEHVSTPLQFILSVFATPLPV